MSLRIAANGLLAVACAAAAGGTVWSLAAPVAEPASADRESARADMTPKPIETGRFQAPPLSAFDVIAERPLFAPSRAPAERRVAAPVDQAPAGLALTGVMITGERRQAVFTLADRSSDVVAVGDEIAGWRVVAIEPGRAVVEKGGVRREAHLDDAAQAVPEGRAARRRNTGQNARRIAQQMGEDGPWEN